MGERAQVEVAERVGHTPGPWTVERSPVRRILCVQSPTAWICGEIANEHDPLPPGEPEANACLIAAAPDMLAALKAIATDPDNAPLTLCDSHSLTLLDAARAAIAKAEGR